MQILMKLLINLFNWNSQKDKRKFYYANNNTNQLRLTVNY